MKLRHVIYWGCFLLLAALFGVLYFKLGPKAAAIALAPGTGAPAVATAPPRAPQLPGESASLFARFMDWADGYVATARPESVSAGVELARERRAEIKKLIQTDPKR